MARTDLSTFNFDLKDSESLFQEFIYEADRTPVDLTGGLFRMQIRDGGSDGTLLSTLTTANGRIAPDADQVANVGVFRVDMDNADVKSEIIDVAGAGSYDYDILYTSAGGISTILFGGKVNVTEAITDPA